MLAPGPRKPILWFWPSCPLLVPATFILSCSSKACWPPPSRKLGEHPASQHAHSVTALSQFSVSKHHRGLTHVSGPSWGTTGAEGRQQWGAGCGTTEQRGLRLMPCCTQFGVSLKFGETIQTSSTHPAEIAAQLYWGRKKLATRGWWCLWHSGKLYRLQKHVALPACFLSLLMCLVATSDMDLILNQNEFVLFCKRDNEPSRTGIHTLVKCINI